MKTVLGILLVCLTASTICAQTPDPSKHKHHNKGGGTNGPADGAAAQPDPAADMAAQVAMYQKTFVPADPWRIMNGEKPAFAKGGDWVQFEGRVTQSSADGMVLQGWYGEPLGYMLPGKGNETGMTFFLSNFPRRVPVGQFLSRNDRLVALKSGTKNEMTLLDYGTVYVPQMTVAEEQKAQAASNKSKTEAKVLAWHQELADKGDAYGEYKMGMRYLNGDGVDKDAQKARDMLTKATQRRGIGMQATNWRSCIAGID